MEGAIHPMIMASKLPKSLGIIFFRGTMEKARERLLI